MFESSPREGRGWGANSPVKISLDGRATGKYWQISNIVFSGAGVVLANKNPIGRIAYSIKPSRVSH